MEMRATKSAEISENFRMPSESIGIVRAGRQGTENEDQSERRRPVSRRSTLERHVFGKISPA